MDGWLDGWMDGQRCLRKGQKTSATHQDDLLDVFGLAPVEHPGGVVLLDVLVHTLDLLVPRDEEGVVSNEGKPKKKGVGGE